VVTPVAGPSWLNHLGLRTAIFFNLSGDTHPIHFHLVNVQVVSRQPFDVRRLRFLGPRPPDANERGW
jgi:hypothetical protein